MVERARTLVVDDEKGIRFFLEKTLQKAGYDVATAASGEEALALIRETAFALVILDLKLGGRVDGLRVLEAVKWLWPQTVVVILTAHGTLDSALTAIREGVDGYLLKPVEPDELRRVVREALARRERMARVDAQQGEGLLQRGPLTVDLKKHLVSVDGIAVDLTPREFRLLVCLMEDARRVVSARELVRVVREYECEDEREARDIIKWYVHRLRQKVEPDPSAPQFILTVRGVGYTFSD
ncbi:MAG: response regulator transcription factor [Anaerolineae bacterium]|nr:response regulator transcription factor [Anaerolineae bacterium]